MVACKITNTANSKTYKVDHKLNCGDKSMIYMLACNRCRKLLKTTYSFIYRWNNYKCNDCNVTRIKACMQQYLFSHINCEDLTGFLENVSIALIDKIDGRDVGNLCLLWN